MRLSGLIFIRKSWSKSINNRTVYNRIGFKCIYKTVSRQHTELFYKLFTRETEPGRSMGGCNFRNVLPINRPKMSRRENLRFLTRNFQSRQNSTIWNLIFTLLITDIVKAMNTLIQERDNHSKICITVKVSRRAQKVQIYLANEGSGLAFFSTNLGHIFGSNVA